MGVAKIIGAALRPGVSLKHESHRTVAVDVLRALAQTTPIASALIHARQGSDDMLELHSAVKEVALAVFHERGWEIPERRAISSEKRLAMFVEQCWREYMGAPCKRCRGHGFVGLKYEHLKHRLDECAKCQGRGFVFIPFNSTYWMGWPTEATQRQAGMRQTCSSCRGKRLIEVSEEVKTGKLKVCMACWGSGSMPARVSVRARALRYDHMHVYRIWQERFRVVLMQLRAHEREGLVIARDALFGPP